MSNDTLDTLWYTRCPVPTGLGIALQQGWLEAALRADGTSLRSLRESDQEAVRESHFDHTLQNSVRHGGNIPALWARAAGRETRVIGLSWSDETQLILTLPGSGIDGGTRTPSCCAKASSAAREVMTGWLATGAVEASTSRFTSGFFVLPAIA